MKGTRWIKQVMRNGATLRDSRGKWHSELWTSEKSYSRERRQEAQCLWGGDLYGAIKMQQRVCVAAAGSQEEVQQEMQSDQWGSIHIENPILLKIKWNNVGGFWSDIECGLTYAIYDILRVAKLGGLKQQKCILSQFWSLEVQNESMHQ